MTGLSVPEEIGWLNMMCPFNFCIHYTFFFFFDHVDEVKNKQWLLEGLEKSY